MILGGALGPIQKHLAAFIILYGTLRFCSSFPVLKPRAVGLFLSSAEAGPGVATILISGEVYPVRAFVMCQVSNEAAR